MNTFPNSPTDPLEVLCDNAVRAIRRHVAHLHAEVAVWEPKAPPAYWTEPDPAPARGYRLWSV
jgi:hypothetical protein